MFDFIHLLLVGGFPWFQHYWWELTDAASTEEWDILEPPRTLGDMMEHGWRVCGLSPLGEVNWFSVRWQLIDRDDSDMSSVTQEEETEELLDESEEQF